MWLVHRRKEKVFFFPLLSAGVGGESEGEREGENARKAFSNIDLCIKKRTKKKGAL